MALSPKFKTCLKMVLHSEGGNDDDPDDLGGRTSQGITQEDYDRWMKAKGKKAGDVWKITPAERDQLYHDLYWLEVSGDKFPLPIAYVMFDAGVLSGVGHSRKLAQKVVGVRQDGILGPNSTKAISIYPRDSFVKAFSKARLDYLKSRSTAWKYFKGWKNRQDRVLVEALAMIKLPND